MPASKARAARRAEKQQVIKTESKPSPLQLARDNQPPSGQGMDERQESKTNVYSGGNASLLPLPPLPPSYCSCSSCMFQFPFKHSKLEVRDAYENSKQKKVYPVTIFDRAHIAASKNLGHCHWDVEAWCCDRSQCELTSATGHMGCIPLGLRPQATWDVRPQAV